jgi:hypothetical protein
MPESLKVKSGIIANEIMAISTTYFSVPLTTQSKGEA